MRTLVTLIVVVVCQISSFAQTGIGTTNPDNSAALDVASTTKGFLPPRMNWTQIQAIQDPVPGLTVYDIGVRALRVYDGNKWSIMGPSTGGTLNDAPGRFGPIDMSTTGNIFIDRMVIAPNKSTILAGTIDGTLTLDSITATGEGAFIAKLDSNGYVVFIKVMPCTNVDIWAIALDPSGNIYLGGQYTGSIDLNPSPLITSNFTSAGSSDGFISKYTSAGNYVWGKSIGGTSGDDVHTLSADGSFVYAGGVFKGTVNFGPSTHTAQGPNDCWVSRFTASSGSNSSQWVRVITGPGTEVLNAVSVYSGGGVVVAGAFGPSTDIGTFTLTSGGQYDGYIAFINNLGVVTSADKIGGTGSEFVEDIETDAAGNLYATGTFGSAPANFALSGTAYNLSSQGSSDVFIAKYDNTQDVDWVRWIGGTDTEDEPRIAIDNTGAAFVFADYESTVLSTSTSGMNLARNYGGSDAFVAKVSSGGTVQWLQGAGSKSFDGVRDVAVSPDGRLMYTTAYFYSPHFTLGGVRVTGITTYLERYEE